MATFTPLLEVTFRQQTTGPYDSNWFQYGPDNNGTIVFNTDNPNVGWNRKGRLLLPKCYFPKSGVKVAINSIKRWLSGG